MEAGKVRFRELSPVNFSQLRILEYFWAVQLEPPTRMSDLYKCLKSNEVEGIHRDRGLAHRYEFEADEVVYIPKVKRQRNTTDAT